MCYVDSPGYVKTTAKTGTLYSQEEHSVLTYNVFLVLYSMGAIDCKEQFCSGLWEGELDKFSIDGQDSTVTEDQYRREYCSRVIRIHAVHVMYRYLGRGKYSSRLYVRKK